MHKIDRSHVCVCPICNKKFNDPASLRSHVIIHSDEKPFKCEICSASYQKKYQFNNHMNKHTKAISYQCQYCDKLSYCVLNHKLHMKKHHSDKFYVCHICSKKFKDVSKFNDHKITHTIFYKLYKQENCSASTSLCQPRKKKSEANPASDNKPYKCDKCVFSCTTLRSLSQHKTRIHKNLPEPSHDLVLRRLRFTQLQKHSKSFTKCSKYECGLCKKTFPSLTDHNQHLPSHKDETLTTCMICKASFSFTTELIEHCLEYSSNEHHLCKTCREKFETSDECTKHKQTRHAHPCDQCKKSFFTSRSLREHSCPYKTTLFCEFCSKEFTGSNSLNLHIRKYHSQQKVTQITSVVKKQQFNCEKCTKSFMSKNKLVKHKSCRCDFCDEPFDCKLDLLQHRVVHNKPPDISLDVKSTKCVECHKTFIDNDKYLHYCIGRSKSKNNFNSENIVQTDSTKKYSSNSLDLDDSGNLKNVSNNHEKLVFFMDSITIESNVENDVSNNKVFPVPNNTKVLSLGNRDASNESVNSEPKLIKDECSTSKKNLLYFGFDKIVSTPYVSSRVTSKKINKRLCVFCDKTYYNKWSFKQHVFTEHVDKQLYMCEYCKKEFSFISVYKSHLASHKLD